MEDAAVELADVDVVSFTLRKGMEWIGLQLVDDALNFKSFRRGEAGEMVFATVLSTCFLDAGDKHLVDGVAVGSEEVCVIIGNSCIPGMKEQGVSKSSYCPFREGGECFSTGRRYSWCGRHLPSLMILRTEVADVPHLQESSKAKVGIGICHLDGSREDGRMKL